MFRIKWGLNLRWHLQFGSKYKNVCEITVPQFFILHWNVEEPKFSTLLEDETKLKWIPYEIMPPLLLSYLNSPQEVRSFGIATITGIFLPYFRLWLNIFQFVAPDLNSTRRFPIDPITPFWSGEVTIATILESVIGREGPLDNNGIYKVVMLRF